MKKCGVIQVMKDTGYVNKLYYITVLYYCVSSHWRWPGLIFVTLTFLNFRSSRPEVFLRKGALKIYSKFTGEHPCRSAISIKLHSNVTEIALRHGCSPVNLLHIFRTPFLKNTSGWLLL